MSTRALMAWPVLLLALLAACTSPAVPGGSQAPSAAASTVATASAAAPATPGATVARVEGLFDIGGGRELYLRCIGSGSPTILLEAGDGDTGTNAWSPISGELDDNARTCVYDRAGLGRSSPAEGCRQIDDILDDLDTLLGAAEVTGPFLLVGTSGGGFLMAGFAARHPDQVAGMVFAEVPKALTTALYPDVVPLIACDAPDNVERRDYLAVEHAAWDNRKEIGDFPMTVISNDYGDEAEPNTDEYTNVADQRGWLDLTSGPVRQVVVTSGHGVVYAEPNLVLQEILDVLAAARSES